MGKSHIFLALKITQKGCFENKPVTTIRSYNKKKIYIETFKGNRCRCGDNVIKSLKSNNICGSKPKTTEHQIN